MSDHHHEWTMRLMDQETAPWEVFHENSKVDRVTAAPDPVAVVDRMRDMWESVPLAGPTVALPPDLDPALSAALLTAIDQRVSAREMVRKEISLRSLATLLRCSYGITRDDADGAYPRRFRPIPSGGALYPLELFVWVRSITDVTPGLYHYNPVHDRLTLVEAGVVDAQWLDCFVDPTIPSTSSAMVFVTAMFERATFKYGDRGYRFALIEAGHLGQNLSLVGTSIGLATLCMGGYFDRDLDSRLGLDGVAHSCVYVVALGGQKTSPHEPQSLGTLGAHTRSG